jgi:glycine cleavage system aminomethyltransferase T
MVDFGGWDMPVQYTAGGIASIWRRGTPPGFSMFAYGRILVEGEDAIRFG